MQIHFSSRNFYPNIQSTNSEKMLRLNARNQIKQQRSRPSPKTALPVHLLESYRRQVRLEPINQSLSLKMFLGRPCAVTLLQGAR